MKTVTINNIDYFYSKKIKEKKVLDFKLLTFWGIKKNESGKIWKQTFLFNKDKFITKGKAAEIKFNVLWDFHNKKMVDNFHQPKMEITENQKIKKKYFLYFKEKCTFAEFVIYLGRKEIPLYIIKKLFKPRAKLFILESKYIKVKNLKKGVIYEHFKYFEGSNSSVPGCYLKK